jgi:cytochrome c2
VRSPRGKGLGPLVAIFVVGLAAVLGSVYAQRHADAKQRAAVLAGGDPDHGPDLMIRYGCAGCHEIPGVRGPGGRVGPSLAQVGARVYVGGMLPNTPDNLVHWIVNPREINPKTAMPRTGISEAEARHVAAYLLSLR